MAASWERMLANAFINIDEVEGHGGQLEGMTLGGTSMMLRINHRASQDIDFLVPDPQLLGVLSAVLADAVDWHFGFRHRGVGHLFVEAEFGAGRSCAGSKFPLTRMNCIG